MGRVLRSGRRESTLLRPIVTAKLAFTVSRSDQRVVVVVELVAGFLFGPSTGCVRKKDMTGGSPTAFLLTVFLQSDKPGGDALRPKRVSTHSSGLSPTVIKNKR